MASRRGRESPEVQPSDAAPLRPGDHHYHHSVELSPSNQRVTIYQTHRYRRGRSSVQFLVGGGGWLGGMGWGCLLP